MSDANPANFEQDITELEKIVKRMEQGQQPLDESLKDYQRGVELYKKCDASLRKAEQVVEQLVKGLEGENKTVPFRSENS